MAPCMKAPACLRLHAGRRHTMGTQGGWNNLSSANAVGMQAQTVPVNRRVAVAAVWSVVTATDVEVPAAASMPSSPFCKLYVPPSRRSKHAKPYKTLP